MMTIEEMKERKRQCGYTNAQIADLSGVPLGTVQKIFTGETRSPRYETLRLLEKALKLPRVHYEYTDEGMHADHVVRETSTAYDMQKPAITAEEFYALPDSWKGELIDGVLYAMSSPTYLHQYLAQKISRQMEEYVENHHGDCLVLGLPVDTHVDCGDETVVEPDITVLCDRSKLTKSGRIWGAPDLVVEILSPSTKNRDVMVKMPKYLRSGVREYWAVDSVNKIIYVYMPDAKVLPQTYTFSDHVPVGIWGGDCLIDFPKILKAAAFLYE